MLSCLALAAGAEGRTLRVGPRQDFARPSQAAAAARAGDRIEISAGTYYDCAVWTAPSLTIVGAGAAATRLTDTTCQGKAIMVIVGHGTTVADLTLARARVPDGNGAGIRAEAPDLTLQRVRFEDDQDGLLAGDVPGGVLRVEDCVFAGNGVAGDPRPTASLVVGAWALLEVQGSRFERGVGQSAIVSRAKLTHIDASRIDAPAGGGATVQAGGLVVDNSALRAGAGPDGRHAAVLALPAESDGMLTLRKNVLEGGGTLLLNWSGRDAELSDNTLDDGATLSSSAGSWRFRLRRTLRGAYDSARAMAGALHWRLLGLLHGR